jgi:hypothetical protein
MTAGLVTTPPTVPDGDSIVLALAEKTQVLGIDDKNGIKACKLLGVAFTTAIGILVRMRERPSDAHRFMCQILAPIVMPHRSNCARAWHDGCHQECE